MEMTEKEIRVTEDEGIYKVSADFESGFRLVPLPEGYMQIAFWNEERMKVFLKHHGYYPVIVHMN